MKSTKKFAYSRLLALRGYWRRAWGNDVIYHPDTPSHLMLNPDKWLQFRSAESIRRSAFIPDDFDSFDAWQIIARERLAILLGYSTPAMTWEEILPIQISKPTLKNGVLRDQIYLDGPDGRTIVISILRVDSPAAQDIRPAVIVLQGTNGGMHLSWGEIRGPADVYSLKDYPPMALGAIEKGFIAVCVEQFGAGERAFPGKSPQDGLATLANKAMILGKTMLGIRVEDAVAVSQFLRTPYALKYGIDPKNISIAGHSSGGMTAIFAGALECSFNAILCSGSLGSFQSTIMRRDIGNGQSVIPGFLSQFEMADIVSLIAPRYCLIVSGDKDPIWPFEEAQSVTNEALKYFGPQAEKKLVCLKGIGRHQFYSTLAWPTFAEMVQQDRQEKVAEYLY